MHFSKTMVVVLPYILLVETDLSNFIRIMLLQASSLPEAHRKVISEHVLKKMIEKLQKNQSNPAVFEENFPLYVLLVARMHR